MESFKEKAVEVYREISQLPFLDEGRISSDAGKSLYQVELKWSQKDIDRGKNIGYAKSYVVQKTNQKLELLSEIHFQRDTTAVQKESFSSNGSVKTVLLKDKSSKDEQWVEPQQFIEIWRSDRLVKSLNVKEQFKKSHGLIHVDNDQFSSFQLSSDGSKLLYVAEKRRPESVSFFKKKSDEGKDDEQKEKIEEGTENVFQENWGEQLTKVVKPVVVVLDIGSEECSIFDPKDKDLSLGKAQWLPGSSTELVFVGYENNPRKLGYIYCVNRFSVLYAANTDTMECTPLHGGSVDISSPRFNPQGSKLVFIEFNAKLPSPHMSCGALKMVDWKTKEISTVIDIVRKPLDNGFTGIYSISFPQRCWDPSGEKVYFSSSQKALVQIVCVDTVKREAGYITTGLQEEGTYSLQDVCDGLMLFYYNSPSQPPIVFLTELPSNGLLVKDKFCRIAQLSYRYNEKLKWSLVDTTRVEGSQSYQSVLVSPLNPSKSPPPLVVWPHGGPHVSFTASFIPWVECFTVLGFSILLANYHGSSGFGQDFLEALPGNVGSLDVEDVQYVAETVVKSGSVDKDRIFVTGGSHGGFLTIHLIGQFPDFYKAAFIRNPVIDMASMSTMSDIPDWCYCEGGLPYNPSLPPTPENYSTLLKKSPIYHAKKIKAPLVIALGGEDLRCPPNQGKQLYFNLKAQDKDVSLYWYPKDCHPLMSVDTTGDCFMHLVLHFFKHCNY